MTLKPQMSPEETVARLEMILSLPLHRFFNLEIIEYGPGWSHAQMNPTKNIGNPFNVIHGGVFYATLDFAAFIALIPLLKDSDNAVTHDIHVSVLRPGPMDQPITLKGEVTKMGKRIAFCDAKALAGDVLIAQARVTKSIVTLPDFPITASRA